MRQRQGVGPVHRKVRRVGKGDLHAVPQVPGGAAVAQHEKTTLLIGAGRRDRHRAGERLIPQDLPRPHAAHGEVCPPGVWIPDHPVEHVRRAVRREERERPVPAVGHGHRVRPERHAADVIVGTDGAALEIHREAAVGGHRRPVVTQRAAIQHEVPRSGP